MLPMIPMMAIGMEIHTALTFRIVGIIFNDNDHDNVLLSAIAIAKLAFIVAVVSQSLLARRSGGRLLVCSSASAYNSLETDVVN